MVVAFYNIVFVQLVYQKVIYKSVELYKNLIHLV